MFSLAIIFAFRLNNQKFLASLLRGVEVVLHGEGHSSCVRQQQRKKKTLLYTSFYSAGITDSVWAFLGYWFSSNAWTIDVWPLFGMALLMDWTVHIISFKSTFSPLPCRRSWLSGLSTNDVVLGLIIANVAVFMLWRISDHRFMLNNFTVSSRFINWML